MATRRRGKTTFGPRPSRRRFATWGVLPLAIIGLGWLVGLIWFVGQMPTPPAEVDRKTDAIVVLTGGSGRLETGLDLIQAGWGDALFVSGVYASVDVQLLLDVFQRQVPEISCCIELGHAAGNTRGNALETETWVRQNNVRTLRLVTSRYHMERALLEFRQTLGDTTIIPHPVQPTGYDLAAWWRSPRTFRLVAWEYTKLLLAHLRLTLTPGTR